MSIYQPSYNDSIHPTQQVNDCFVDASENLFDGDILARPLNSLESGGESENDGRAHLDVVEIRKAEEEEKELKVRLEEVTVILRMALNNEFARALEICGRR